MDVSLREITAANRAALEALSVTEEQAGNVADVTTSLQEALEYPDAMPWYRAIYVGETPVGFIMLSDGVTVQKPEYVGPYYLWRLVVDQEHQGRGYGAAALRLVVEYVRTRPGAEVLLTSVVPGPASPLGFYLRQGFRDTGTVHEGEQVLELDLGTG